MKRYASLLMLFALLWPSLTGAAWIAKPGTVKVYVRKKSGTSPVQEVLAQRLRAIGADIVDDRDTFLTLQVALPNASASPQILRDIADVVEMRNELDLVQFNDYPIDARDTSAAYPPQWERKIALPSPARDAFVLQFATVPRPEWIEDLKSAGATVLDYIPQNAYVVLADQTMLRQFAERTPVQLLRLHQPIHKASAGIRQVTDSFVDAVVSVAKTPEADDALAFLQAHSIARRHPSQNGGNRTYYFMTIDTASLAQLAALPAVLYLDVESHPTPSGEREAHLTIGDTLVTTASGDLRAAAGDLRQWIADKGLGSYKTALKIAILDTGFDLGDSFNVHPDFKDSGPFPGTSFVTVRDYTSAQGADADCYGHGTMVAGVISGNAGGPNSTADRDAGASHGDVNFYMGQGIVPELPIVVGRIFNYLQGVNPPGLDFPNPLQAYTELAGLGVKIANNSWNDAGLRTYSLQSRTNDMLVRSANGQDGGPQMVIYFSAGNAEGPGSSNPYVSPPATAKNVISIGASKNYNQNTYSDIFVPPAYPTAGISADNANQVWPVSQHATTIEGRLKPDLVAPGTGIESAKSRSADACQLPVVGATIDAGSHRWSRGSSFASPLAAGAGALLYTWFKNQPGMSAGPTPALLKAAQITLASELSGTGSHVPDGLQSWGKVDLTRAFATDGRYAWQDESTIFTSSGQASAYLPSPSSGYRIKDTTKPVRITLVWTDAPAAESADVALKNDLDLTVRFQGFSGAGSYMIGNDFDPTTGRTRVRTSGGSYDSVNNVEQVVFTFADTGADHFQVEVFPHTVGDDGINIWHPGSPKQNFAVFLENAVAYQNNAAFLGQAAPSSVAAGANYQASFTFQNSGNTDWSEGPVELYRLGYLPAGGPYPWGSRLYLDPGQVISNPGSKAFSLNVTAPYAAGPYPLQWQMLEEPSHVFGAASTLMNVTVTASPSMFYTLTPCRIVDTRGPTGTYGAPALVGGGARTFPIRGQCGVPNTAKAVSVNLAVVAASGQGFLKAYPANISSPSVSTLNYRAGQTRANNAIVTLDTQGNLVIEAGVSATDILLDVNGYFQ